MNNQDKTDILMDVFCPDNTGQLRLTFALTDVMPPGIEHKDQPQFTGIVSFFIDMIIQQFTDMVILQKTMIIKFLIQDKLADERRLFKPGRYGDGKTPLFAVDNPGRNIMRATVAVLPFHRTFRCPV